jgi:hypothetical protein
MPVHNGKDSLGSFYQWGNHGHKYYYISGNSRSRLSARGKATRQGRAAYANGYKGKGY